MDIQDLARSKDSYHIFYSGPKYNPSAVLFVLRRAEGQIKTAQGWKEVDNPTLLGDLLSRMDIIEPKLSTIVPSDQQSPSPKDILAYIYTPGDARVQTRSRGKDYFLQPVPEQFNPVYYDPEFEDPLIN